MRKSDSRDTIITLCGLGLAVVALNRVLIPWWVKKFPPKTTTAATTTTNTQSS